MSYLKPEYQDRIASAYHDFKDIEGFAKVVTLDEIRANDDNLSIPLYIRRSMMSEERGVYAANGLKEAVRAWEESSERLSTSVKNLLTILKD